MRKTDIKDRQPIVIAIEGIDGSGKGTQYNLIKNHFDKIGKKYIGLDFPCYEEFFGREIGSMLSGKTSVRADNVDPKSMTLWYAVDRMYQFTSINNIKQYDYILMNRYTLSNMVYQSARYNGDKYEFAEWVFELEHKRFKLPIPDMYIIFDVDPDTSRANVLSKEDRSYATGVKHDVYEDDVNLLATSRDLYIAFSKLYTYCSLISCGSRQVMRSIGDIHADVIRLIDSI